jgi:hypothetical protein
MVHGAVYRALGGLPLLVLGLVVGRLISLSAAARGWVYSCAVFCFGVGGPWTTLHGGATC